MKAVLVLVSAVTVGVARAQVVFTAVLDAREGQWGTLALSALSEKRAERRFTTSRREEFFRMLYHLHQWKGLAYRVDFGKQDTLTVQVPWNPELVEAGRTRELALRTLLNALSMTYRVMDGVYYVVHRPFLGIPMSSGKLEVKGSAGALEIDVEEGISLDVLARALALGNRGYRVEKQAGARVSLKALRLSLSLLLQVLSWLDEGIEIVEKGGEVVVRGKG